MYITLTKATTPIICFEFVYLTKANHLNNSYSNYNGVLDLGLFHIRPEIAEESIRTIENHVTVNATIKWKCCMYIYKANCC